MNKPPKSKTQRLEIRLTHEDKKKIEQNASKCGLSTSEYVKQRALGFEPKAVLPDVFFHFCEKVDELMGQNLKDEVNDRIIELMTKLENELIRPRKEDIDEWR